MVIKIYPCPNCKGKTDVIDSRINPKKQIRRRRKCMKCGYRFSTIEIVKEKSKEIKLKPKEVKKRMKEGYQKSAKENAKVAEEMEQHVEGLDEEGEWDEDEDWGDE
jgi:transcriptional repressor NrdR